MLFFISRRLALLSYIHLCFSLALISYSTSTLALTISSQATSTKAKGAPNQIRNSTSTNGNDLLKPQFGRSLESIKRSLNGSFEGNESDAILKDSFDDWSLMCYDMEAFPSSPSTIQSLNDFYGSVYQTIHQNISELPAKSFTFTTKALQLTISCATQVISWEMVLAITQFVGRWTRMGFPWMGTIAFHAAKETMVFIVSVQLLIVALAPMELPTHNVVTGVRRDFEQVDGEFTFATTPD